MPVSRWLLLYPLVRWIPPHLHDLFVTEAGFFQLVNASRFASGR